MAAEPASFLQRFALRSCAWSERWIPDAFVFAVLAVLITAVAALGGGASPASVAAGFGQGFWSLITFTMQMCFVFIGGFALASSPPVARAVRWLARRPRTARGAICWVATASMLMSLLHWALSMIVGCLLVRELVKRRDLKIDYRAAGAAAYLGLGSVWALGLSSSAAQLQANPASMPPELLQISGVLPFTETIFLWQSIVLTVLLVVITIVIVWLTVPDAASTRTADEFELPVLETTPVDRSKPLRPGDRLEYSPVLSVLLAVLGFAWLVQEFAAKGPADAIANLNTYNFLFLMGAVLLCWRPRTFLDAAMRAVPLIGGVLIQYPLYGGIAGIMTKVPLANGESLSHVLAVFFSEAMSRETFPVLVGLYSAVLGFFIPSGGGKWIIEAPYVMQAANDLQVHLGWAVQIYNAAEALPNLINPFFMLPVLGMLGLRARDIIGFTIVQFIVHVPVVLFALWLLGLTLEYHPPVMP
jgi:short-chain fatty acids transporter